MATFLLVLVYFAVIFAAAIVVDAIMFRFDRRRERERFNADRRGLGPGSPAEPPS